MRHSGVTGRPNSRVCSMPVKCAGKGFGSSAAKPVKDSTARRRQQTGQVPVQIDGTLPQDKAVKEAVEEAKARSRGLGVRPVDPKEAAKGKLDYVQVQDWGSGAQEDLGNLKVKAVSERYGTELDGKPFYEQLARQLELAESRGELKVASAPGDRPLPPFKLWSFSMRRYKQYLADASEVHGALGAAVARALAAEADASSTVAPAIDSTTHAGVTSTTPTTIDSTTPVTLDSRGGGPAHDVASTPGTAAPDSAQGLAAALAALGCFASSRGLDRHQCIEHDLQALVTSSSSSSSSSSSGNGASSSAIGSSSRGEGQASASSDCSSGGTARARPRASGNARAYAAYLAKQGERAAGAGADSKQEQQEAALRLFAGAYAVHASHLAAGVRVGAAATEKLGLFALGATQAYQRYPDSIADPLKQLVEGVNAAGLLLSQQQRQVVFEELPRVMVKTSMLLEALAHDD